MLNRILLSFLIIINLHKFFHNVRSRGAFIIFVLGLPLLPLLNQIKNLNNDFLKLIFLIHFVLFFAINYLCVQWGRKKTASLTNDEKNEISLEWAILNVLIIQMIQAGVHYFIFMGYQHLLS